MTDINDFCFANDCTFNDASATDMQNSVDRFFDVCNNFSLKTAGTSWHIISKSYVEPNILNRQQLKEDGQIHLPGKHIPKLSLMRTWMPNLLRPVPHLTNSTRISRDNDQGRPDYSLQNFISCTLLKIIYNYIIYHIIIIIAIQLYPLFQMGPNIDVLAIWSHYFKLG